MLIFYILVLFAVLWGCKFAGKSFFAEESVSRPVTDSVKGIFIWLVFLSHFSYYVDYTASIDLAGKNISLFLGQLVVAMFLFYSGYGVCESIKKRGSNYVNSFPKNRIAKTLLHFDIAVLLFLATTLILGQHFSLKTILLSFTGWESLGNSNWYIFVVLMLYIITYVSFLLFKRNMKAAAATATVLTLCLIVFLRLTRFPHWYDTALCYILGIWFSIFKEPLYKFLTKSNTRWAVCFILAIAAFLAVYYMPTAIFPLAKLNLLTAVGKTLVKPLIFCLCICILLLKVKISNSLLSLCGKYTFELFILQRIPMMILQEWGKEHIYLYFILSVAITVILTVAFSLCIGGLDRALFKNKRA